MDKRLSSLTLLYAGFFASALYLKATTSLKWGVFSDFILIILFGLSVAIVCFSVVLTILAIIDIALRRQVVDDRYFTRIFLYKLISLLCVVIFVALVFKMDFPLLKYMIGPKALIFVLSLMLPFSLHTISGLIVRRKRNELPEEDYFMHIIMQFLFCLDIISSLILMHDEKKRHPEERTDLYTHAFGPRPMPVPGLYGVLFAICAVLFLISDKGLVNYGVGNFLFYLRNDIKHSLVFQYYSFLIQIWFTFLLAIAGRAIFDAAYFLRKQQSDAMSRLFPSKVFLFSMASIVLEAALLFLLNLTVGLLLDFTQSGGLSYRSRPVVHHILFISLLVTSFILVQASVFLYTRFAVKRSLSGRLISDKKASLLTWLSLVPVWQLVAVYFIFKSNRDQLELG